MKDMKIPFELWLNINIRLSLFREYLKSMGDFIDEQRESHHAKIADILHGENLTQEEMDFYDDLVNHGLDPIVNEESSLGQLLDFENLLSRSLVIGMYSYLESGLLARCRVLEETETSPIKLRDMAGQGITKAMNYLIKVHNVGVSLGSDTNWSKIQKYRDLRNCLVHEEGRIGGDTQAQRQLLTYLHNENHLSLSENGTEIIIFREFCEDVLHVIGRFLYSIDSSHPTFIGSIFQRKI